MQCLHKARAGLLPHCEYPTVVMFQPYNILLFGGSQDSVVGMGRQISSPRQHMMWHINVLTDEWRAAEAQGTTPTPRSGHSAVMYDNQVRPIVNVIATPT
jgi:hypothetical protein